VIPVRTVRIHLRTATLLVSLVLLAVALTWLISGKEAATAMFQSPPFDSGLPTPTGQPSASPTGTATSVPTSTSSPVPTMTSEPTASPTPPGFLPPPTLTSPGTPVPAEPSPQLPAELLPLRPAPTETPGAASQPETGFSMTLAGLIDQGVLALGYLWLCCGIFALIGVGGALFWFFRRARRA
jgi:hypothetical protein